MAELKITGDRSTVKIVSDSVVIASSSLVQALLRDLDTLDDAIHLATLEAKRLTVAPLEYKYEFVAKDARRFFQSLLIQDGVRMTFDTFGFRWIEEKEFVFHRPIRATVITLIRDYGLEKLDVLYH